MDDWLLHPPLVPVLAVTYILLGGERIVELAINRRNTRLLAQRGAIWTGDDGLRLILLAQVVLFLGWPLESLFAPWATTGWWTWPLLALALAAQALRYWVINTLGERWSIRVVTIPGAVPISRGPYRFARHPNYVAVATEALVLPLAFGAIGTALVAFPLQLLALRARIAKENHALERAASSAPPAAPPADGQPARGDLERST